MAVKVREWKGAWWVFTDFRGRRKARRVGVGTTGKRAAQAAAEKIAAKLALGDLSPLETVTPAAPPVTFRAYAERWLAGHVRLQCKPSTLTTYTRVMRTHWIPALGAVPLAALTRDRIKGVLAGLAGGLRASTISASTLPPLQGCLSAAVEDGLLVANPASRLGRFVRSDVLPQARQDPLTREELTHLLATAEAEMPEWYPALLTVARTGLRFGELAALRANDLDFQDFAVLVCRAAYEGRISTPKNQRGRRVDMSRQLAHVLQGSLSLRAAEAVLSGRPVAPTLFPGPDGGILRRDWFEGHVWRPLLRRAGLRYRTPHQLRHSFATLLIAQGESLAYVRDQLRHASIKLTVDTYGHLIPGSNRQAVDRLDDATGRNLYATAAPVAALVSK
jgi:integrase